MDIRNKFHTRGSYALMRLEHIGAVIACSALLVLNFDGVDWLRFAAAFIVIDAIGYLPGAIALRKGGGSTIAPAFHYLYNFSHNYLTWATIVGLWAFQFGGFEWAMLAIPIHLSGDRGVFGNVFKPAALPFEPTGVRPFEGGRTIFPNHD